MKNHKLPLFSLGNFDQTTRISAKVRYKQVSSMKLSYFLEIFLQQSYICKFFNCNGPKLRKYENTEKSRTDGCFMVNHVYNTEFSVEKSLEHGFAI